MKKAFCNMEYKWYEEINNSDEITQGDIIRECSLPAFDGSFYDSLVAKSDFAEEPIEIKSSNIIILSQACDLENEKINSVVMCPVWTLRTLVDENHYFRGSKARESLRQGKEPAYHLLNLHSSNNLSMDYSVVDFHQLYSLPKDYLKKIASLIPVRLRLLPPYREHLSQAFARYFMRVGLPLDINKDKIKNYGCD
jgi:hypothetical protein